MLVYDFSLSKKRVFHVERVPLKLGPMSRVLLPGLPHR